MCDGANYGMYEMRTKHVRSYGLGNRTIGSQNVTTSCEKENALAFKDSVLI